MSDMTYISTRGEAPDLNFEDVLLAGLARDGGLYVPKSWPQFSADDIAAMRGLSYVDLAVRVMHPFMAGSVPEEDLRQICADAYGTFFHEDVVPVKPLGDDLYLMELFHGPTLAFKDMAMQVLSRLFDYVLAKRGTRITIVGATSGDTGAAAVAGCRDRDNLDIYMLHPKGRVSPVQERQMTTVLSSNVYNIALEGTFDDCQDLVKAMFNDLAFRDKHQLSAVNSINWVRVMAQIVYYFWAALKLGAPEKAVSFSVPTGNFGNVFAGYAAKQMGLPITQLVIGSNANDILTRFLNSGAMEMAEVVPTISPSMDIQVSSNFERLLFDLVGRDGKTCAQIINDFRKTGRFEVAGDQYRDLCQVFAGARFDDGETKAIITDVHQATGELLDPHTAVGVGAARAVRADTSTPMIVLATAHPAKFADAVQDATGVHPDLPPHLADLFEREERQATLPNDLDAVENFVNTNAG